MLSAGLNVAMRSTTDAIMNGFIVGDLSVYAVVCGYAKSVIDVGGYDVLTFGNVIDANTASIVMRDAKAIVDRLDALTLAVYE